MAKPEDEYRFRQARPGDHVVCSFQCEVCQVRNLRGHTPTQSLQDEALCALVRRANLDAFWSRSSGTVRGQVTEVRFQLRYGTALGLEMYPPLGPFPLGQHNGMKEAVGLILRAKEPGAHGPTAKFSTTRKSRSAYTNVWEASPASGGDVTFSEKSRRLVATLNPTEGAWFVRFMRGLRIRMGQISRQDRAISIGVMHELMRRFETDWERSGGGLDLKRLSSATFCIVSFCGGFRGCETTWTDLAALRHDLEHIERTEDFRGIGWPIVGRFKAEGGGEGCHVIPIACETRSGLRPLVWAQRFVKRLEEEGHTRGWAFRRDGGGQASAADYREIVFGRLLEIQGEMPTLIEPEVEVEEEFGMQRSFRRGFTTECKNQKIGKDDLNAQCRWRSEREAQGNTVQRAMHDHYADYRLMKDVKLRPSQAL